MSAETGQTPRGEMRGRTGFCRVLCNRKGFGSAPGKRKFPVTDLHRIEKGAKFPQQDLPHVVTATCVSQDQHWSPATAAGKGQLQKQEHTKPISLNETALGRHNKPPVEPDQIFCTLLYSSGSLRRSLFTW